MAKPKQPVIDPRSDAFVETTVAGWRWLRGHAATLVTCLAVGTALYLFVSWRRAEKERREMALWEAREAAGVEAVRDPASGIAAYERLSEQARGLDSEPVILLEYGTRLAASAERAHLERAAEVLRDVIRRFPSRERLLPLAREALSAVEAELAFRPPGAEPPRRPPVEVRVGEEETGGGAPGAGADPAAPAAGTDTPAASATGPGASSALAPAADPDAVRRDAPAVDKDGAAPPGGVVPPP